MSFVYLGVGLLSLYLSVMDRESIFMRVCLFVGGVIYFMIFLHTSGYIRIREMNAISHAVVGAGSIFLATRDIRRVVRVLLAIGGVGELIFVGHLIGLI